MEVATDIQLTQDQLEAKEIILSRLYMGSRYVSLKGYAGTGKTFLTSTIATELTEAGEMVYACAPTHKAAYVLGKKMPIDTQTIHSFLGLKMIRNNRGGYSLRQDDRWEAPPGGTVLLDESSMVGKQLWKYIDQAPHLQWLFVGDPAQLPPVAEKPSPALEVEGALLQNIVRQAEGNPILRMAERVRNREPYLSEAKYDRDTDSGVYLTRDSSAFMDSIVRGFKAQPEDRPPEVRVLAYRNVVVAHYNEKVRQQLLGTKRPPRFAPGDWLMMQNTFFEDQTAICKNSEEVLILENRVDTLVTTGGFWKAHFLTVRRENGQIATIPILHEQEEQRFKNTLSQFKDEAISGARPWTDFYTLIESFAEADHAYSMTVHKSQGSTFHTVYLEHRDLLSCRGPEKQALIYVGVTRPSHRLALLI